MIAKADTCIFIGKSFYAHKMNIEGVRFFESTQEAIDCIKEKPFHDSLILLKASRGMAFENIIKIL
jgi:UDP-N-acetylmuramoyl-tripeptide--D-alanyl-D-alanine ligase